MAQYVYSMNRVGKIVPPNKFILKDISLSFFHGAKIGVLGVNGSGKSTLLKIMAGIDKEIEGEAIPQAGLKIGYLPQEPQLDQSKDVRGNIEEAVADVVHALKRIEEVYAAYAEEDADFDALAKEQGELEAIIQSKDGHNLDNALERAADALRLPPWDADVSKLSGGERRRVALCRLLLEKPDMLLLDEPTNHLDAESVAWLERFLHDYEGTVVAIKTESARQKSIKTELEWVRSNAKGRQSKSKARMARFEELSTGDYQKRNETNELFIPPGERLGEQVIEVNNLRKSYGERLLIDDLTFAMPKGAIVGIVGPNGAGKSTLFRMLSGEEQADSGDVIVGKTVKLASVDQFRDHMDGNNTVYKEISDDSDIIRIGNFELNSRAYCSRFNFKGNDQQKFIKDLSGGERNRVHLAKLLKAGGNVLLLDEPTNDLDVETLRALENALLEFPGCAMVISHDRWFLDRIATHIMDYRDEGKINFFAGNYSEYTTWLKETQGKDVIEPHRLKYKKISK